MEEENSKRKKANHETYTQSKWKWRTMYQ